MTALEWDKTAERIFQTGIDRGVLSLQDGTVVPWNGLTSFEDTTTKETVINYIDGMKYLEYNSPGDFSGKIHAFTYPPDFDKVNGIIKPISGLRIHDQPSELSYRTIIGNDIGGVDFAYVLNLLYNVLANPDNTQYTTLGDVVTPEEFSWTLSAKPVIGAYPWRPSSHLSIDSREISSDLLQQIEDILYGTDESDPQFPTIEEILTLLGYGEG